MSIFSNLQKIIKNKPTISVVCILIVFLIVILSVSIGNHVRQEQRYERNLGEVFEFDFTMDMDDIIDYEARVFGNTEYEYDSEYKRLEFAPCDYGTKKWRHRYFFDDKTGLLTSVYYMDVLGAFSDLDEFDCEHIKNFENNVLKIIGSWDEETEQGLFKIAYVNIDGTRCKIKYQDASDKAIFIYLEDK